MSLPSPIIDSGDNDECAMTVLSTLRQRSHPAVARLASTYAAHRPLVQRILTAGFIAHVLATTFSRFSTRPSPPSGGRARENSPSAEAGKPPRVAVRKFLLNPLYLLHSLVLGRRLVLSEALSDPSARNTESPLKGGTFTRYAL
jgi:hypothetical protein